jgi:hypothetical protein
MFGRDDALRPQTELEKLDAKREAAHVKWRRNPTEQNAAAAANANNEHYGQWSNDQATS